MKAAMSAVDQQPYVGDFIHGNRRRIGFVKEGAGNASGHWALLGNNLYAVDLRMPTTSMRVSSLDVLVKRETVEQIAHAVAERIQATVGLTPDTYAAATKLLNLSEPAYYANRLFDDPADRVLRKIFDDIIEEIYGAELGDVDEIKQVACLAIFSVFLAE